MPRKSRFCRLFGRDKRIKDDDKESSGKKNSHQPQATVTSSAPPSKNTAIISTKDGDVHQSAQMSHVLADIEPQSHQQVASAIDASASSVPLPNTGILAIPPPATALNPAATTYAIQPEQLWDRAYDDLKTYESALVMAYEKILSRELDKDAPNSIALESQVNTVEQIEPAIRRLQMRQLVQAGLKKTEAEAKAKQNIGNAMRVILSAKNIVSSAVQVFPQAALAWTGVCFALQILLNPSDESKANSEGIIYVMSRMEWYWTLSELIFEENKSQVDGESFTGLQCELKNRIVDLYRALLVYQMKSVCSYYRNRGLVLLGDIIKLENWDGSLKTVQDAETVVRNDSEVYRTTKIWKHLEELVNIARNGEMRLLGDIYSALQEQDSRQIEREDKREDNQCLKDLRSTNPNDDMIRIERTKGGLLEDSYVWILGHDDFIDWRDGDETRLLWIRGDPGKGKTMLLIGIIREFQKSSQSSYLLSYFFCQGTDSRLNNATAVLRGLMYQLLMQQRFLISHLREQYDKAGRQLFEDVNAFDALSKIFADMLDDSRLTKVYLIVDALDECDSGFVLLLDVIVRNASTSSSRVKWLVSSRNQPNIEERLRIKNSKVELSLELNAECVSGAIAAYIDYKVSKLERTKGYDSQLCHQVIYQLHQKAKGTFLWVAIVCQELEGEVENWDVLQLLGEIPSDLKLLYARMIEQIQSKSRSRVVCMQILSTMTLAYRPFHLLELTALTDLPKEIAREQNLRKIVRMCNSFLTIRDDTIYFIHQSAKDFLSTCMEIFPDGQTEIQHGLVSRSLQSMKEKLYRDMHNLQDPGISINQVKSINPDPLTQIRYACVYWIDHLCEVDKNSLHKVGLYDDGEIHRFLKNHFLYWLEALSLMRNMANGVVMMRKLEDLLAESIGESRLLDLVRDGLRFILHNGWVIENAPLQAYASALVFSPVHSLTRQLWTKEDPEWIITKPIVESDWSLCLQTLEGHVNSVMSVVFSHDSSQLASASEDGTVKIWDAETGKCQQTLEGHGSCVTSVVFSHDSKQLASASNDGTVKIWDAETGECLQTLEGQGGSVRSVVFSHDSRQLAWASNDGTIKIWDTETSKCQQTLESHSSFVMSVVFSCDSRHLASASNDSRQLASVSNNGTIKIWDTGTGKCQQTLNGHGDIVRSVVFSHDSRQLASASNDRTVKIWDAETGKCLQTLEGHGAWVMSVVFSYDSRQLASASNDNIVKIWDAETGKCLQTLEGHGSSVRSVVFSHDSRLLASASNDGTIKIWQAETNNCLQTRKGHGGWIMSVVFSCDLRQLASASNYRTVKIWDTETGKCLRTLEGHGGWVTSAVFSHDSTQLASASNDGTVKIWDAETGKCLQTLEGHGSWVASAVFLHNSKQLASASNDRTVKIWDAKTGKCLQTLEGHGGWVELVVFSQDSTQLASDSNDGTVKIWDTKTGKCLRTLQAHGGSKLALDPTGSYLKTDLEIFTLGQSSSVQCIARESDGIETRQEPQRCGYGLSLDRSWVTCHGKNVLWLPSEYRPGVCAISGAMVGIGSASGRVLMIRFSPAVARSGDMRSHHERIKSG
jgi:WD40 repeat protein